MRERGYDGEQGVGRGTKERRPIDLVNLHREEEREREADVEMCPSRPLRALFIWRSRVTKKKTLSDSPDPSSLFARRLSISLSKRERARWKTQAGVDLDGCFRYAERK